MYRKILVALDHSPADESLLPHVTALAKLAGAELVLLHVATGWATQWHDQLQLEETREMREDRAYVEEVAARLRAEGLTTVRDLVSQGDPAGEILKTARSEGCDLIAMASHGHRFVVDILMGSTIEKVRHEGEIPILVVRGTPKKR